ncbi:MAG: ABC transporter permease [Bacteroidales bacterium]|nr:ABC transporter permease [Bacteroidales bacterium]
MSKLSNLYKKDLILGFKDIWILLEIGAAVMITAMLIFIVPKDIKRETSIYIQDNTGVFELMVDQLGGEKSKKGGQLFVDSREDLVEGMRKNKTAFGMIISPRDNNKFHIELLTQPYSSNAMVEFLEVQMTDVFTMIAAPDEAYSPDVFNKVRVRVLKEKVRDEIPFNQRLIPMILVFIVGFMGLFTMISLIGQERSDQTIRAYKVTPSSLLTLLISKHLLLLTIGFITFTIVYLPTVGLSGYLLALLVITPTILIGSSLGVMLGSFFDNPMGAIGWVFLFMVLFGLPGVSLFAPAFSPDWLKFIPSYYTLFGLDAAIFPDGYSNVLWISVGVLFGISAVLLPLSSWIFTRKLRREF